MAPPRPPRPPRPPLPRRLAAFVPLAPLAVLVVLGPLASPAARAAAAPTDEPTAQPGDVIDPPAVIDPTAPAVAPAALPGGDGNGHEDEGDDEDEENDEHDAADRQGREPTPRAADVAPIVDGAGPRPAAAPAPSQDPAAAAARLAPPPPPPGPEPTPQLQDLEPRVDPRGERRAAPGEPPPTPADSAPGEAGGAPMPEGIGFGGVPALNYDSDNGFGFGVVGTLFSYDGVTRPYRLALTLQIFMTSKLVQDHNVVVDWLQVGGLPLRLWMRAGYLQSLTQNYCGLGGAVTCDPAVAAAAAQAEGLVGDDADAFARRYYQRRFINPYGTVLARYALAQAPARFEVTAGWRGFFFIPGTWDDEDGDGAPDFFPYQGSLYAKDFPDGEPGFDSAVQLGFMVDSRDNEPAPTEGVWLEGSVRAASSLIGSAWNWAGANLTLRGYTPLTSDHKLVLANRLVLDGVLGDPPIQELARAGGSFDYYLYGGSEAGRGIRAQRYLGKLRAFDQTELRWRFWDVDAAGQRFGFTAVGFFDAGIVGAEIDAPGPMDALTGVGTALRVSWNENFIVRFDLGFSPLESWAPSLYILIGNPF